MKKIRRLKKIKLGYVFAFIILVAVAVLVIKLILPGSENKYGDRLDGIDKVPFNEKAKTKVTKSLSDNENIIEAKIKIDGKLINVIFTVKKEVSVGDARRYAEESLGLFSDKVKGFYDIQYMIKKDHEEGTKETKTLDDGTTTEVTKYEFPIMGYKNKKAAGIVW